MTAQSNASNKSSGSSFIEDLNGAVRANPIAAGLVGMGVLWMFFGGSKISVLGGTIASATKGAAGAVGSGAEAVTRTVGEGLAATGARAGGLARHVGDSLTKTAQDAGAFARDTAASGYDALTNSGDKANQTAEPANGGNDALGSLKNAGHEFSTSMQNNLNVALERQPLLLGVIGVAIGAGIASTFASTTTENKLMGETGTSVKDGVRSVVGNIAGIASQAVDDMKTEADTRGLTPSAIKDQVRGVGDKLKTVAGAARDSVKERLP